MHLCVCILDDASAQGHRRRTRPAARGGPRIACHTQSLRPRGSPSEARAEDCVPCASTICGVTSEVGRPVVVLQQASRQLPRQAAPTDDRSRLPGDLARHHGRLRDLNMRPRLLAGGLVPFPGRGAGSLGGRLLVRCVGRPSKQVHSLLSLEPWCHHGPEQTECPGLTLTMLAVFNYYPIQIAGTLWIGVAGSPYGRPRRVLKAGSDRLARAGLGICFLGLPFRLCRRGHIWDSCRRLPLHLAGRACSLVRILRCWLSAG